jgi:hypothetical protein
MKNDDSIFEIPDELKGCPGTGRRSDPISGSGFVRCSSCGGYVPGSNVDGTALPHERHDKYRPFNSLKQSLEEGR